MRRSWISSNKVQQHRKCDSNNRRVCQWLSEKGVRMAGNEVRIIVCHEVGIIIVKEVRVCSVEVARMDYRSAHSPGWMCAAVGRCAGLLALVSSSSSLPFLLSWLSPSPPGVGLSRSGLLFHSWCHAS